MAVVSQNPNSNPNEFFGLVCKIDADNISSKKPDGFGVQIPTRNPCIEVPQSLLVLADATGEDLQNDISSFLFELPNGDEVFTFTLQKYDGVTPPDGWADVITLVTGAYGTYYAGGFNSNAPKFTGYQLNWSEVLANHGEGSYRIQTTGTIFGSDFTANSNMFCLKIYSEVRADNSVRFEWRLNGITPDTVNNAQRTINYADMNWLEQYRIIGFMLKEEDGREVVEKEFDNNEVVTLRETKQRKYTFTSGRIERFQHQLLERGFLQDDLLVTDYNKNNDQVFQKVPVRTVSGYGLADKAPSSVLRRVVQEFTDRAQPEKRFKSC